MSFSKEDKAAWLDSEVMFELEKIAQEQNIFGEPPEEAFKPIDESWEDDEESENNEEVLEEPLDLKTELSVAYNENLFSNLKKIANLLAEKSNIKAAYRVEMALYNIKELVKEAK